MKQYPFFIMLLMIFISVGFYFYATNENVVLAESEIGVNIGEMAPVFNLKNINDDNIHVDACTPCRGEMLENVYAISPIEYDEQNDGTCQDGVCSLPKHNSNDNSNSE